MAVVVVMCVSGQQGGSGPEGRPGDGVDGGRMALDNKTSLLNTPLLSSPRGARDPFSDSPFKHSLKDSSIDDLEQSTDGTGASLSISLLSLSHALSQALSLTLTLTLSYIHIYANIYIHACMLIYSNINKHDQTHTNITHFHLDVPATFSLPVLCEHPFSPSQRSFSFFL